MLDWNDLRIFLAIVRERTLSAAARQLKVDQSTVGRRLAALEEAAGARLFERMPSGYALTAAGESVLETVEQIEGQAIAVERKLRGQDARVAGRVRVAASDSFATWFLVRRLSALRDAHPDILLEFYTGNRPVDLARREADISLRMSKPTQPNLIARRVGIASWAPYASVSYLTSRGTPSARNRFAGHDVVDFDDELSTTIGARWLKTHATGGRVVLTTNSLTCQGAAVLAGLGVSALPCIFGDVEPSLRRISPGVFGHHEVWLVVHPDVNASARVRAVLDYLTMLMKAEAALLSGRRVSTKPRARP